MVDAYPHGPGHRWTDTSIAAAKAVAPANGRLQRLALHAISEAGKRGLTSQELAERTGVDFAASQPRTSELRRLGLIRDSGQRRKNRSGKQAIVWIAAEREAENG